MTQLQNIKRVNNIRFLLHGYVSALPTMISAFKRIHNGSNTRELVRSITEHDEPKYDNRDVFMEFPNERELFLSFPLF